MARRAASRFGKFEGAGRVDRPMPAPKTGSYRTAGRRLGDSGGTVYPSVIEAYNRDSDYKRWKQGLEYFQGVGRSWADYEVPLLVRSFADDGSKPGPKPTVLVFFPSDASPDAAWTVVNRLRGAIILDQPLQSSEITLQTSLPDPSQHRLVLDVSASLTANQLKVWRRYIGDQFEDGAIGTNFSVDLLENTEETVSYTLVEVDVLGGRLIFDLSRPFVTRLINGKGYWRQAKYDPLAPRLWRSDGSRYLCSSHRFYCSCPDFTGSTIADLSNIDASRQARFPTPGAGRSVGSAWESQAVGYEKRWRDVATRADRRRECKHIHSARWGAAVPFLEPSDYPIGESLFRATDYDRRFIDEAAIMRYHRRRGLTIDRLAPALGLANGLALGSRTDLADDVVLDRTSGVPVLWATPREPRAANCIDGDWWIEKGGSAIKVFNESIQRFAATKPVGPEQKPLIEEVQQLGVVPAE